MRAILIIVVLIPLLTGHAWAQNSNRAAYDWGVALAHKRGIPDADCYGKVWERFAVHRPNGSWFVSGTAETQAEQRKCGDNFAWYIDRKFKGWDGVWGKRDGLQVTVRGSSVEYTYQGAAYPVRAVKMDATDLSFDFGAGTGHIDMRMNPDRSARLQGYSSGGRPISMGRIHRGKEYNP